jgi:TetR/AcrR family transcriptional regulator
MKTEPSRILESRAPSRNPERTQERIFQSAFQEFAAQGFAGARVDRIARQAGINKRMLYHYFGDKRGLFREVLRRKMAERKAWGVATPNEPTESLPYWFDLAWRDLDWVRLLEWEALQFAGERLIDERRRQEAVADAVRRIGVRQELGYLSKEFSARHMLLAMTALTWFPLAFPQLTRLITGQSAFGAKFRGTQKRFLRKFSVGFQPRSWQTPLNARAKGNRKRRSS